MPKLNYAIVGNGSWGTKLFSILKDFDRKVLSISLSRKGISQAQSNYRNDVIEAFNNAPNHIDTVWLAVPPCDQFILVDTALDRGWNIIVEKPWDLKKQKTKSLINKAKKLKLQIGVHHQYCYLDVFKKLSHNLKLGQNVIFSGKFNILRKNRLSIPAFKNLASHLFAIKMLHFPLASTGTIETSYDKENHRSIFLQTANKNYDIDFTNNTEPLIQRFILDFEKSVSSQKLFQLNLDIIIFINEQLKQNSFN